jgi:hypothetical protein
MTDLGPIHWLLGIQITRNRNTRTISLSQRSYIDALITRFSMTNARPYGCAIAPGNLPSKADCPTDPEQIAHMRKIPYREAIGGLMYLAVATRPDISFAVSILSRFLDRPGILHWEAVKRIMRYLIGT